MNLIRRCVPSRVAYQVGAERQRFRPKPSNNESHNRKLGARTARQRRICQHSGRARLAGSAQNERMLVNVVRQGMPNMLRGFFCCGQGTRSRSEGMDAVDWPTIESVRRLRAYREGDEKV